jgi:hypothetical protein
MSILDIFSSKPAPVAAPAAPAAPATPADATQTAASNADATSNKSSDVGTTPLDGFTKLWETDTSSTDTTNQSLFGDLDPKKVFEAAKGANFAGAISPEVLQAVAAGGEGATAALQQAINSSTQAAFAQAMLASTKLIEQAITKTNAKNLADLPGLVKRHTAADSLHTENPALSNPAAAPIIAAVQAQLALKHPDATASQLKAMATDYLSNFAEVVKPTKAAEPKKPAAGDIDWSTFLTP